MANFIISSIKSKDSCIEHIDIKKRIGKLVLIDSEEILVGQPFRCGYLTSTGYLVTTPVVKYSLINGILNIETINSIYTFTKLKSNTN